MHFTRLIPLIGVAATLAGCQCSTGDPALNMYVLEFHNPTDVPVSVAITVPPGRAKVEQNSSVTLLPGATIQQKLYTVPLNTKPILRLGPEGGTINTTEVGQGWPDLNSAYSNRYVFEASKEADGSVNWNRLSSK